MERNLGSKHSLIVLLMASVLLAPLVAIAPPARAAASLIFTVTTADDPGNNNCLTGGCTLREAIIAANANAGADTIEFDIPGAGVHTIAPTTALPAITEAVTIDGYTQPGTSVNTKAKGTNAILLIELSGQNAPDGTDGLIVQAGPTTIRGLVINRFGGSGGFGILFSSGPSTSNNVVEGNFIGTSTNGSADRGNGSVGLSVLGDGSNRIGGSLPAERNLISGNDGGGLFLNSVDNTVEGNLIGTDRTGTKDLGNDISGVSIEDADNTLENNVIAFNNGPGVAVLNFAGVEGNFIRENAIFKNTGLGIDLNNDGPTLNDGGAPPDADTGPNGLQNFPVITSAKPRKIRATLQTIPNNLVIIEFFANPKGEKEGKEFLGAILVVSDANGTVVDGQGNPDLVFTPPHKLAEGTLITSTASTGDGTSEFSKAKKVT